MTESDKKRFDEIFHNNKHFRNVTDGDMLRTAGECEKLFDYMQGEGFDIQEERDVKLYMHFAYWLGAIERDNWD